MLRRVFGPWRTSHARQAADRTKRVYEVDPLRCPRCGHDSMQVVSFIESHRHDVLEKILRHCGLSHASSPRAPPPVGEADSDGLGELRYVDDPESVDAPLPEQVWSEP